MKSCWLLGLLGLFVAPPVAAEWVEAQRDEGAVDFFDPSTASAHGSYVRMWSMTDLLTRPDGIAWRSARRYSEYDCFQKRLRILEVHTFDGPRLSGATQSHIKGPTEWSFVGPRTLGQTELEVACKRAKR